MKHLAWTKAAWADYMYWQGQDRKTLKRINKLMPSQKVVMLDLIQHPVFYNTLRRQDSGFRQNDDIRPKKLFARASFIKGRVFSFRLRPASMMSC